MRNRFLSASAVERPGLTRSHSAFARGSDRKTVAAASILTATLITAAWGFAVVREPTAPSPPPPPWPLPPLRASTPAGEPWQWDDAVDGPAVLLYVSRGCPHCRLEVGRWAAIADSIGATELWLVLSPGSDPRELSWLPATVARSVAHDATGSVASALRIRLVPTTLFIDGQGTVRRVAVGETSMGAALAGLALLAEDH